VQANAFSHNLVVYRDDQRKGVWDYWGSDPNQAMIAEFAAAIREQRAPAVSGLDGLRAAEVVLAAYESIRTAKVVRV